MRICADCFFKLKDYDQTVSGCSSSYPGNLNVRNCATILEIYKNKGHRYQCKSIYTV